MVNKKKSRHGCGRWAPQPHLTPPCSDFTCRGLKDIWGNKEETHGGGGGKKNEKRGEKKKQKEEGRERKKKKKKNK